MEERINDFIAMIYPTVSLGDRYIFLKDHIGLAYQGLLDYDFSGITTDMNVLDLGACVGGFTIRAAERCKHVYAVEPLYPDLLQKNLELNNIKNVTILPYAIGEKRHRGTLKFGREREAEFVTFEDILSMIYPEKIQFMKCDIEGAEKYVDFNRIPNVEAEIHDQNYGESMYHQRNKQIYRGVVKNV